MLFFKINYTVDFPDQRGFSLKYSQGMWILNALFIVLQFWFCDIICDDKGQRGNRDNRKIREKSQANPHWVFFISEHRTRFTANKTSHSWLDHRTPPTHLVVASSCPSLHIRWCSRLKHHFVFLPLSPKKPVIDIHSVCLQNSCFMQLADCCIPCLELSSFF